MFKSKKAQREGTAVAILLIVIALFMTLYILFIPPQERNQLLQKDTTETGVEGGLPPKVELLAESPGLVTPTTESATVHRIPSVNVFLKEEPKLITLAQNLFVSKGLFSKSFANLKFQTRDLDETTKLTLFFSVDQTTGGELRFKVNGNTVYAEEIKTPGVKIIEVAKSFLQDDNKLEISVSSPGVAFWKTNKYNLKDVGVKQEFERRNNEESRTFVIPAQEKNNLKSVKIKYTQVCNFPMVKETTHLDILVNEQRAHEAEIRCITTDDEFEIDPDLIIAGTNTITFRLEKGDFSFNLIKLETETRTSERPTFYFSLNQDQFNAIKNGKRNINLHMLLEQNRKQKNSRILINSNEILMQTDRNTFDKDLRDYVLEGTNFIKIIPVNSFNIVGLKVTLE
ncbi:hypothetical protein HYU23_01910 [Candidatus Woesearchaeota archaeon]|nr:hypothetical protein [Candidatus Woesearchaeota archaeon]